MGLIDVTVMRLHSLHPYEGEMTPRCGYFNNAVQSCMLMTPSRDKIFAMVFNTYLWSPLRAHDFINNSG